MLDAAIAEITQLAVEAAGEKREPTFTPIPGTDRRTVLAFGNEKEVMHIDPPDRKATVRTLDSFVAAMSDLTGESTLATVWHSDSAIIGLLDDKDRRETVTLPLTFAMQFNAIRAIDSQPAVLEHRAFIRFLNITMRGTGVDTVVPQFRDLRFRQEGHGQSRLKHTDQSVGREISQEVQGTGDLPEQIVFNVPIYANYNMRWAVDITVAIEIDIQNEKFILHVPGDQIREAIDRVHEEHIVPGLKFDDNQNITSYWGSP